MNTLLNARSTQLSLGLSLALLASGLAAAQQPTAAERAALEPATPSTPPASAAPTTAAPANAAPAAKPTSSAGAGAVSKKPPRAADARSGAATQHSASASDRVDLDATTVTGNQELPKVMYIVPWKKSEIGDLAGRPMNSLLDEVLAPVDRDVFRREVTYYDAVKAEASPGGAPPGGSGKP